MKFAAALTIAMASSASAFSTFGKKVADKVAAPAKPVRLDRDSTSHHSHDHRRRWWS